MLAPPARKSSPKVRCELPGEATFEVRRWPRSLAPMLTGAGIKGIVLTALADPCVISPVEAQSMGVRDGNECPIVEKPESCLEAIAVLYNNQKAWKAMSRHAIDFTATSARSSAASIRCAQLLNRWDYSALKLYDD